MKTNNLNQKPLLAVIAVLLLMSGILYSQTNSNMNTANTSVTMVASAEDVISVARPAVTVAPNPSTGPVTVSFTTAISGKIGISVMDSRGTPLFVIDAMAKIGNNKVDLDLSPYGSGNYAVIVSGAGIYGRVVVAIK